MTYTIIARDRKNGTMALGVISHSFSVRPKVMYRKDVGTSKVLLASQAFSSRSLGRKCADMLLAGAPDSEIEAVCHGSQGGQYRQVAYIVNDGRIGAFTGSACVRQAAHVVDEDHQFVIAGNMMQSDTLLEAMALGFTTTSGTLVDRVLTSLRAGVAEGGDFRGDRSAGIFLDTLHGHLALDIGDSVSPWEQLSNLVDIAKRREILTACHRLVEESFPRADVESLLSRLRDRSHLDNDLAAWRYVLERILTEEEFERTTLPVEGADWGVELYHRLGLDHEVRR